MYFGLCFNHIIQLGIILNLPPITQGTYARQITQSCGIIMAHVIRAVKLTETIRWDCPPFTVHDIDSNEV